MERSTFVGIAIPRTYRLPLKEDDSINKETPFVAMNPSFKEEMNLKDIDFTEISNVIPDNKHANDPRNCYNKLVP